VKCGWPNAEVYPEKNNHKLWNLTHKSESCPHIFNNIFDLEFYVSSWHTLSHNERYTN